MTKVQLIMAAGGSGERMKSSTPKPLLLLKGEPVVVRTLRVFEAHAFVFGVILVVPGKYVDEYRRIVDQAGLRKVLSVIPGGSTRSESVRLGLQKLDADTDLVMVHDAVRPFVTELMINEGIALALRDKAAIAAVPVKPTLKVVDAKTMKVKETLDRSMIWEIQTPQVFDRQLLERAYKDGGDASDDASLVEKTGHPVGVYMGDYRNIKITTPEDMLFAESLL